MDPFTLLALASLAGVGAKVVGNFAGGHFEKSANRAQQEANKKQADASAAAEYKKLTSPRLVGATGVVDNKLGDYYNAAAEKEFQHNAAPDLVQAANQRVNAQIASDIGGQAKNAIGNFGVAGALETNRNYSSGAAQAANMQLIMHMLGMMNR